MEIDHLLDSNYEPLWVQFTRSVTVEETVDPTIKTRGRKSSKVTRKVVKQVEEEKELTLLKNTKAFIDNLAEEKRMTFISMDGRDNSLKIIANLLSKHHEFCAYFITNFLSLTTRQYLLIFGSIFYKSQ